MIGFSLGYNETLSIPLDEISDLIDYAETLCQVKLKGMGIEIVHIRARQKE